MKAITDHAVNVKSMLTVMMKKKNLVSLIKVVHICGFTSTSNRLTPEQLSQNFFLLAIFFRGPLETTNPQGFLIARRLP